MINSCHVVQSLSNLLTRSTYLGEQFFIHPSYTVLQVILKSKAWMDQATLCHTYYAHSVSYIVSWCCLVYVSFTQIFHELVLLHWNNHMNVDVIDVARPWRIEVINHKSLRTDCITTTKQRRLWIFHGALVAHSWLTEVKYGPVITHPDSKVHGANMGPHVVPTDLAIRALYFLWYTQKYNTAHPHGYVWYVFYQCKLSSMSSLQCCCTICCAILHWVDSQMEEK